LIANGEVSGYGWGRTDAGIAKLLQVRVVFVNEQEDELL
jgi:hypothetical protein